MVARLPDSCFAYVPDEAKGPNGAKSARKLPLCDDDTGRLSLGRARAAAQAISGSGLMGNRVRGIPRAAMAAVKRKIRAALRSLRVSDEDMPESIRG